MAILFISAVSGLVSRLQAIPARATLVMLAERAEPIQFHSPRVTQTHPGYEAASGSTIGIVGERRCWVSIDGETLHTIMRYQVADVRKPLLVTTGIADMRFECVLGARGGYLIDTSNGERTLKHRTGNLYILNTWLWGTQRSLLVVRSSMRRRPSKNHCIKFRNAR